MTAPVAGLRHHPLVVRLVALVAATTVVTGWIGKGICRGLSRDLTRLD